MTRSRRAGGGLAFVVSSPSGGGKTTVVQALLTRVPGLRRSVSVTTRLPRAGERRGVAYRFVTPRAFHQLRRAGRLLEWARVHQAEYGTPREPVERALARGEDVVLSLDVQGARAVRRALRDRAVLIFLLPPSLRELRARLVRRQTETSGAIRRRLQAARQELARLREYDYAVVNRQVPQAVTHLQAIVTAERLRINNTRRSA